MIAGFSKWVGRQIEVVLEDGQRIDRFELWTSAGATARLDTFRISSDATVDAGELADEIWDAAVNDARTRGQGLNEKSKYTVISWMNDRKDEHESMFNWTIDSPMGSTDLEGAFEEDFAPTGKGLLRQLMQHNQQTNRIASGNVDRMMGTLMRQNETLTAENKMLRMELRQGAEDREELESRRTERAIQLADAVVTAEEKQAWMGTIRAIMPVAAAKLMPGIGVDSSVPGALAVKELVTGLDEDEIGTIMMGLKDANRVKFMMVVDSFQKAEKKTVGGSLIDELKEAVGPAAATRTH